MQFLGSVWLFFVIPLTLMGAFTLVGMLYAWRDFDGTRTTENGSGHGPAQDRAGDQPDAESRLSFSLLVPARHEQAVLEGTLERLAALDHPAYEVLAIVGHDDPETAEIAHTVAARHPDIIRVVVDQHVVKNKPRALNTALPHCRNDVIGVFDAEDVVHPKLLKIVERQMLRDRSAAVQAGVQLVNFGQTWFTVRNCLEYYFWFRSRLRMQADLGFIPLGGNTVFMRRSVVELLGGWDGDCLAEDCEIGVRLSAHGLPISVIFDPALITREEAPIRLGALLRQRTRWNQGFVQVLERGEWRRLPHLGQRLLGLVTLLTPMVQAFAGILIPLALIAAVALKLPDFATLVTFIPIVTVLLTLAVEIVGLYDLGRLVGRPARVRDYLRLAIGLPAYQALLAFSALRALWRHLRRRGGWEKTEHLGVHLADGLLPQPESTLSRGSTR